MEQNPLPAEFRASTGLADEVALLRTQVLERIIDDFEVAGADPSTTDLIIIERVSFIYAYMRSREMSSLTSSHGFRDDQTYKGILSLLFSGLDQLSKRMSTAAAESEIRAQVLDAVITATEKAVNQIADPELRALVLANLRSELGAD